MTAASTASPATAGRRTMDVLCRTRPLPGLTYVRLTVWDGDEGDDYHVAAAGPRVIWSHATDRSRRYTVAAALRLTAVGCTCNWWEHRGHTGKPCRHMAGTTALLSRNHLPGA